MFKPICWKRAAVLHRYLSRNGTATRIIFGVRGENDGKVDGHAWLEANGEPILEKTLKLKREEAAGLGYEVTPYDALLDEFSPGMTSAEIDTILAIWPRVT